MPILQARHAAWTLIFVTGVTARLRLRVRLELSLVQLAAVVEEELVGGFETGFDAVFHDVTGAWWRC